MSEIHIKNYDSGRQPEGQTWDTEALQRDFSVLDAETAFVQSWLTAIGFCAPYVAVRRKSDGVEGLLEFTHSPRVYFDFRPSV